MALEFKNSIIEKGSNTITLDYFVENTRIIFDHKTNTFSVLILTYDKSNEGSASSGIVVNHWIKPESNSEFDLKYQYFTYFLNNFNSYPLIRYTDDKKNEYIYPPVLDKLFEITIKENLELRSKSPTTVNPASIYLIIMLIAFGVFYIVDLIVNLII